MIGSPRRSFDTGTQEGVVLVSYNLTLASEDSGKQNFYVHTCQPNAETNDSAEASLGLALYDRMITFKNFVVDHNANLGN